MQLDVCFGAPGNGSAPTAPRPRTGPGRPLCTAASLVVATALLVAACAPQPEAVGDHVLLYVSRDGTDAVSLRPGVGREDVHFSAPASNLETNTRALVWRRTSPVAVDQQACATFRSSGLPVQEGVALRIAETAGSVRAVTVMKNIYGYVDWVFNVQLIDTSKPLGQGRWMQPVPGEDFSEAVRGRPQPWRLCARTSGRQLQFKVWVHAEEEPGWDDPVHARTVVLPSEWVVAGRPGLYIGHMPANGWSEFTDVTFGPATAVGGELTPDDAATAGGS
jgi:hypothetical protein